MYRVGVVELVGYREWTESLGCDREWRIQCTQASMYHRLQEACSEKKGFAVPLRYDYMLFIACGMNMDDVKYIYDAISKVSPVPVRIAIGRGRTPAEAVNDAWQKLRESSDPLIYVEPEDKERVVVVHIDVNGFTRTTEPPLTTYRSMMELVAMLDSIVASKGGIVAYMGGDNVVCFTTIDVAAELARNPPLNVKMSIGVAPTAREALMLAASGLDELRREARSCSRNVSLMLSL